MCSYRTEDEPKQTKRFDPPRSGCEQDLIKSPVKEYTMNLLNIFKSFKNDESGAVTVDWVVLTAAVVGLGIIIAGTMGDSITSAAGTVAGDITTQAEAN
jgi:Flp pilus assembly pilin Flp